MDKELFAFALRSSNQDEKIIIDFLNEHPQPQTFVRMAILEAIERQKGLEIYY